MFLIQFVLLLKTQGVFQNYTGKFVLIFIERLFGNNKYFQQICKYRYFIVTWLLFVNLLFIVTYTKLVAVIIVTITNGR